MKRLLITATLFLVGITAFCQQETNGTIYIKHPYIDVVNQVAKAYIDNDAATYKKMYADTALYWVSGLEKFIPIADGFKRWEKDFEDFTDIDMKPIGYPDFLHYKKDNTMVVQSWWTWSGKRKSTGEVVKIPMSMFNDFNKDGKIVREYIFGDFSKSN